MAKPKAKKAKKPTTDGDVSIIMVYVGVTKDHKGQRRYQWGELASKGADVDEGIVSVWGKPLQRGATPGAVYEMQGTRTEESEGRVGLSITLNSGRYLGRYHDEEMVAKWQVKHHAATLDLEAASKANRELKRRLDLERLDPFRESYRRAGARQRACLLANLIRYVTSGVELD